MTPGEKLADLGPASRLDLMPSTKTVHPSFYLSLLPHPWFSLPHSLFIHSPTAMYLHLYSIIGTNAAFYQIKAQKVIHFPQNGLFYPYLWLLHA